MSRPRTVPPATAEGELIAAVRRLERKAVPEMGTSTICDRADLRTVLDALSRPKPADSLGLDLGVIAILDRDEVEEHIRLLKNAMEDAERLDAGLPTIHAKERRA